MLKGSSVTAFRDWIIALVVLLLLALLGLKGSISYYRRKS